MATKIAKSKSKTATKVVRNQVIVHSRDHAISDLKEFPAFIDETLLGMLTQDQVFTYAHLCWISSKSMFENLDTFRILLCDTLPVLQKEKLFLSGVHDYNLLVNDRVKDGNCYCTSYGIVHDNCYTIMHSQVSEKFGANPPASVFEYIDSPDIDIWRIGMQLYIQFYMDLLYKNPPADPILVAPWIYIVPSHPQSTEVISQVTYPGQYLVTSYINRYRMSKDQLESKIGNWEVTA